MARYLGADWLRRRGWQGIGGLSDMVGRNGFMSALLVRIIPSAPFIVVNMGLGLTRTSFPAFFTGTAIGIVPKTALIALLGKVVERAQTGDSRPSSTSSFATLGWIGLAFLAKWIVRRREAIRAARRSRKGPRTCAVNESAAMLSSSPPIDEARCAFTSSCAPAFVNTANTVCALESPNPPQTTIPTAEEFPMIVRPLKSASSGLIAAAAANGADPGSHADDL